MRRLALVGLVAGCNQIYGLDPTKVDVPTPDAMLSTARLSYLVGPAMMGGAPAPTSVSPVTPNPEVRIALLDEPFADATYEDGRILYAPGFVGKPWRVEYTPVGELTHEVQWEPSNGAGHLTVPVFGPPSRTRLPAGTGLRVSMTAFGSPHTFVNPVVGTTGYWSEVTVAGSTQTPMIDLHATPPLSGDFGAPDPVAKDIVFALQYGSQNNCRLTTYAGAAVVPALEPGQIKVVGLTHDTSFSAIKLNYPINNMPVSSFGATQERLAMALGGRSDLENGSRAVYARLAHPNMPAFTETFDDVPAPLMIVLADCPASVAETPAAANIGGELAFPEVAYVFAANQRIVGSVRLRSSIAAIGTRNASSGEYDVTFPVQLAVAPKLGSIDLAIVPDGDSMIGDAPLDLTFDLESIAFETDYFDVVLYKLGATALEPVRVYVGPSPAMRKIRFDPTVMEKGPQYVFAIRTYRGRPEARRYDFVPVSSPQAVGTIFTRAFRR